jgi:hypothetical protein
MSLWGNRSETMQKWRVVGCQSVHWGAPLVFRDSEPHPLGLETLADGEHIPVPRGSTTLNRFRAPRSEVHKKPARGFRRMSSFGDEWTPRITPHVRQLMPSNTVSSNPQSPTRTVNGTDRRGCPMRWVSDVPAQRVQQRYYGLPSPSPTRGVDPRVGVWFNYRDTAGGRVRPSATGSRRPMNERAVPVVPEPSCCTFHASTRSPATDSGKRQKSDRGADRPNRGDYGLASEWVVGRQGRVGMRLSRLDGRVVDPSGIVAFEAGLRGRGMTWLHGVLV